MLKQIGRRLYKLLPHRLRVKVNEWRTAFGFKYLGKVRGRQGPSRPEDVIAEKLDLKRGYLISGELQVKVYRGLEAEAVKISGLSFEAFTKLPEDAKQRLKEQAKKIIEAEDVDVGPNTVTDAGVAFLVDDWDNNATDITTMNYSAMGTGGSPPSTPAVTATALVTEVESRVAGTKSQPAANQIRSVATITATAPRTINEWGLFSAAAAGTMWSNRWFTAISLATNDAIEFTYTLTISSFTA
jgi:hypothetical protein